MLRFDGTTKVRHNAVGVEGGVTAGRLPSPAMVWPEVAYFLLSEHPEALRKIVARSQTLRDPNQRRRFGESAVFLRQAASEWIQWVNGTGPQAVSGTTEVPETAAVSASCRPTMTPRMVVAEVATRLDVSERQVVKLIANGDLVATRGRGRGRPHLIDATSVEIEEARRRRNADDE